MDRANKALILLSPIFLVNNTALTIGLTKHYSILHGVRKLQRTEAALKTPSVTIMSSHTVLFVLIIIIIIAIIILSPLPPP